MRLKFETRSVTFKMWTYFMLFAVTILIVLWLLQIVFLSHYYREMKTHQILTAAHAIQAAYGQGDFETVAERYSYQSNMAILVTDEQGNIRFPANFRGELGAEAGLPGKSWVPVFSHYAQMVEQLRQGKDEVYSVVSNTSLDIQSLVYGATLQAAGGGQAFLLIGSPLDPIDSTAVVLKNQLIYISVILLLLACLISFFISRRLSRPLKRLTDSARELAKGNYGVRFDDVGYSEMDQLAATLNYATGELAQTEELRKELIASVSHDLRTPLTMIKAFAEMIRDLSGDIPAKRNAHVGVIIEETDRLSDLVSDMLDLSKIQSGTAKMNLAAFNLSLTVRNMMQRFIVLAEREGYRFELSCQDDIWVAADEKRIEQVVYNLIGNAVHYTGDDKRVFVRLTDEGGAARFEVADTGKGIPAEQLETIWEHYYRAEETHKRTVAGTGLGLSIVKSILAAHRARFGVSSALGTGSTFWFELNRNSQAPPLSSPNKV